MSLTDLSAALGRDPAVVSKQAIKLGIPFATRLNRAPRGPRQGRPTVTLGSLLAMETPTATQPVLLALPDAPVAPQAILRAMRDAGLLQVGASSPGIILLTGRLVEVAPRAMLFGHPSHPYTEALLAASPRFGRKRARGEGTIRGEMPSNSS